jgi:hypothetical protein
MRGHLHAPDALPPWKSPPVFIWQEAYLFTKEGLDVLKKKKSYPFRDLNPDRPARISSLSRLITQEFKVSLNRGHAIAQEVSRWLPTAAARVWVRVWSSRVWCGQSGAGAGSFPRTSVSLANLHSTKFTIIIITRGRHNRPKSDRLAEWTRLDCTPHYAN